MARWLFKEEPSHYNFPTLVRDGRAVWEGVTNALARQHLRQVRSGDEVFFYHTGKEKAVVGVMRVVGDPRPDPNDEDTKSVVVEVEPVRALDRPVTLEEIKADAALAGWDLARLPRLSVVPVTDAQWRRVLDMSATKK
jgi:predicted RNA-binding protein with PUA-like domain